MRSLIAIIGLSVVCGSCANSPDEPGGSAGPAASWLTQNPRIAATLVWDAGDGHGPRAYASWSSADRTALETAVEQARTGSTPTLSDPPVNLVAGALAADAPAATAIAPTDARGLYFGFVGRSLMLEMTHALPWSIAQYDSLDLAVLFDSRSFFRWESNVAGTGVPGYAIYDDTAISNAVNDPSKADGWVVPAPPSVVVKFLSANDLVAADRLTTILRVLEWARVNMVHFSGDFTMQNTFFEWQYRGAPPVSLIIAVTTQPATGPTPGWFAHFTAGCPGTTMFLMHVLRAVNIPVRYVVYEQHALPYFATEGKALDHGDDRYTASWTPSHTQARRERVAPGPADLRRLVFVVPLRGPATEQHRPTPDRAEHPTPDESHVVEPVPGYCATGHISRRVESLSGGLTHLFARRP